MEGLCEVLTRWVLEFAAHPVEQTLRLVRDLAILGLFALSAFALANVVFGLRFADAPTRSASAECPAQNAQLNTYEYELQRRRCEAVAAGAIEQQERR